MKSIMNLAVLSDISSEDIIEGEIRPTKIDMKIDMLKAFRFCVFRVYSLKINWVHSCPIDF